MTIPKIYNAMGRSLPAVQVSIQTIRNCGVSHMNLEEFEKISIQESINREFAK
tara:strand:- start:11616 stop:11774 length:159 start_codon:yes stop_codon:yes gene_type:complete